METYHRIHADFKLNGTALSCQGLKKVACSYVMEGLPHERAIGEFLCRWLDEKEIVKVSTSGSTGTPKAVLLKKEHMFNSAVATGKFFGLKPKDTALHCLPTNFIAGKMMLVRAMVLGLHIDCVKPSSSPEIMRDKKYVFGAMVPLQLQNSMDKVGMVHTLIVGGAPVSKKLKKNIKSIKTRIYETYGMTETITHIAVKKINDHSTDVKTVAPYFTLLPDISIFKDKRGCLVIDAPKICDGPVVTNDLVEISTKKKFDWLGRFDNVINSGGVKIIPEQVEEILSKVMKNSFFVAGIPDTALGEKLILVVEGTIEKKDISRKINLIEELSKYQVPKEIMVLPEFIKTKNGKISRHKTLELIMT